tara:strand:- start:6702 stop:7277 length:576 start_codon:yes stop_codon:yes gene_type:complete
MKKGLPLIGQLFSIVLSAFLFIGFAPIANAAKGPVLNKDRPPTEFTASALTPCSENARFQERANAASTPKDIARFKRYGNASCGDDGLPHLLIGPPIEPFGALLNRNHEGDLLIPGVMFIYITGIIGWSGREYVRYARSQKNAAEYEIIIDTELAWKCLKRGAAWPLHANREGKNGELRERDDNVSLNGPR